MTEVRFIGVNIQLSFELVKQLLISGLCQQIDPLLLYCLIVGAPFVSFASVKVELWYFD